PGVWLDDVPHREPAALVVAVGLANALLVDGEARRGHQVVEPVVGQARAAVVRPDVLGPPVVDRVDIDHVAALPGRPRMSLDPGLARPGDRPPPIERFVAPDADKTGTGAPL